MRSRRFIGDQVFTSEDQVFTSGVLQNHITKASNLSNICLKIPKSLLNATLLKTFIKRFNCFSRSDINQNILQSCLRS